MPVCRSACLQVFEIAGLEFVCVFGHDGTSLFQKGRVLAQDAIRCARRRWNRCLLCSGRRETQSFRRQGRLNSEEMNWMSGTKYQVALSFASEQRSYVEEVARHLQERAIAVFYDGFERVLLWGQSGTEAFHEAFAQQSAYVVMFISKAYVEKTWARHEKRSALSRMIREQAEYILPVRFDDTSVPGLPTDVIYERANDHTPAQLSALIATKLGIQPFDGKASQVPPPRMTSPTGEAVFDYSSYNGRYVIGSGELAFETMWTKASDTSIQVYNDPSTINGIALARGCTSISQVLNAEGLDYTSRVRTAALGGIVVLRNTSGFYAAVHVLGIKDASRHDDRDELRFQYAIQSDGSDSFEEFVISDEVIRALRDPPPARQQQLLQWRDLSVAKCKQSWITLGVPPDVAAELANDPSVGDVLAAEDVSFQVVIGDAGSGKSLAVARFFQHAIENALQDESKPFPLFVNARDLNDPLDEYIERRTFGLVHPLHQPILLILDGLDEKGVSEANALLTQIQCYVDAYPESRVLATSRPLPGLKVPEQQTRISALNDKETAELIGRIAGRTLQPLELYSWSDSVRTAAARPLFAVMIGAELRQGATIDLDQPVDLLSRLARQVVERSRQEGGKLDCLLQKLAVRAVSTGRRVPKADVSLSHTEQRRVANSGLIDESGDTFDFTHEVLREWYAARALIEENASIDEIVPASDRWITAFKLVIESENKNASNALRYKLASSDPGLASLLIQDTGRERSDNEINYSSAEELGAELWSAMDAWRRGFGKLFQIIGPVGADGSTAAVGIRMNSTTIATSWYNGARTLPQRVVPLPERAKTGPRNFDLGWAVLHSETMPRDSEWPWVATRRYLVDSLSKTIVTRRLALPSDHAARELVWAFALAITEQGEFSPRPIRTQEILNRVQKLAVEARQGMVFRIRRLEITPDELTLVKRQLERLLEQGEETVRDPWPRFDQTPSRNARGCSTWDFYSDDRLLERTTAVYSAALQLYMEMVDRWFAGFRNRLRFGRLFPVRLEGRVTKSHQPYWKGAPSLSWCAKALPTGETSRVDLEWSSSEDFDLLSYWKEEENNLKSVRPGTDATPCPIVGDSLPAIESIRPATDLAHSWLIGDLKELNWTDLSKVSLL